MKTRKCKTVSFDLTDEFERQLLSHAEKGNFSRYIKRLIANEVLGWQARPAMTQKASITNEAESVKNAMSGFL